MDTFKPAVILLVEDDPADQKLIRKSMLDQKIDNKLIIVETGEDGLEYEVRRAMVPKITQNECKKLVLGYDGCSSRHR